MAIGLLATVKQMLNIPVADTAQDSFLSDILDAVDDWIESACNRQFANANYILEERGTGDKYLVLPNRPINAILWHASGASGVITVNYSGATTGTLSVQDQKVILVENLSKTEISLTASGVSTISDVASLINAVPNWSATASTLYAAYPALSLLSRQYQFMDSTTDRMEMVASVSPVDMRRVQDGIYHTFFRTSEARDILVIYDGGYSTMPDGLVYVASKIAADAYSFLTRDGALKEEELGDYRYVLDNQFRNDAVQSNWSVLSQYANISL